MKSIKHLLSLFSPGIKSIFPNSMQRHWKLINFLMTLVSLVCAIVFNIKISNTVSNLALPALSIFTALVFTAIFTVPNQLSQKLKESELSDDEATINYLISYHNYIRRFSRQLISLVLLSLLIIVLIVICHLIDISLFLEIITGILIPLAISFVLLIVAVVSNISKMIDDNMEYSSRLIREKKDNLKN